MTEPRPARVPVTSAALEDLQRLTKKDPNIVREVLKKMLLLGSSPMAGEPLVGSLVGFRKLVVGNRHYRIVWRHYVDADFAPVLDIAEVWAAGAREDFEIYREMERRVQLLKATNHPEATPLDDVVAQLGRHFSSIAPRPEPEPEAPLPEWLVQALQDQLHLSHEQIVQFTEDEAKALLADLWSR